MESVLQNRIRLYLENTGLSVAALERKAGLKSNVVRNIIRGKSRKPTGVTLQALAAGMGCTIQDLLEGGQGGFQDQSMGLYEVSPIVQDFALLAAILEAVVKIVQKEGYKITIQQIGIILETIYAYSIKKDPTTIDLDFIDWFIRRTLRGNK